MVEESCLYHNDWLIVFFYINNIIAIYKKKDLFKLQIFKENLIRKYEIKDLSDLTLFLNF